MRFIVEENDSTLLTLHSKLMWLQYYNGCSNDVEIARLTAGKMILLPAVTRLIEGLMCWTGNKMKSKTELADHYGLIIICAPCVPAFMIHGIPSADGFSGKPVLATVA